jgi:hypothetical protein
MSNLISLAEDYSRIIERDRIKIALLEAETARLRAALLHFGSVAASCERRNSPGWMELLADELNAVCEVLGDETRWEFNGLGLRKAVRS